MPFIFQGCQLLLQSFLWSTNLVCLVSVKQYHNIIYGSNGSSILIITCLFVQKPVGGHSCEKERKNSRMGPFISFAVNVLSSSQQQQQHQQQHQHQHQHHQQQQQQQQQQKILFILHLNGKELETHFSKDDFLKKATERNKKINREAALRLNYTKRTKQRLLLRQVL